MAHRLQPVRLDSSSLRNLRALCASALSFLFTLSSHPFQIPS
jgi:hypothetical protein